VLKRAPISLIRVGDPAHGRSIQHVSSAGLSIPEKMAGGHLALGPSPGLRPAHGGVGGLAHERLFCTAARFLVGRLTLITTSACRLFC